MSEIGTVGEVFQLAITHQVPAALDLAIRRSRWGRAVSRLQRDDQGVDRSWMLRSLNRILSWSFL